AHPLAQKRGMVPRRMAESNAQGSVFRSRARGGDAGVKKVIRSQDIGNKGVIAMDMILSRASVPSFGREATPELKAAFGEAPPADIGRVREPAKRKGRQKPSKVRRLIESIERMQLAASSGRQVDGIWIGSFRDSPEDLARVEQALLLVKQHSPVHYSCIINNLERIWISVLRHIGAHGTATRCAWRSPCASPRKTMSSSRNGLTG